MSRQELHSTAGNCQADDRQESCSSAGNCQADEQTWAAVSCWKKCHMTHTIIFLTKFSQWWLQLLFWRNFVRYIHAILFLEHNKWRRLRNSVRIGNQSFFLVETFVLALSYEEGRAERGGLKCFLTFSSAAVLDHECQQRPSYQRQAIGHQWKAYGCLHLCIRVCYATEPESSLH